MADQSRRNNEDNGADDGRRDRSRREPANPYAEWLREQMGETRRAGKSGGESDLDPYGRSKR